MTTYFEQRDARLKAVSEHLKTCSDVLASLPPSVDADVAATREAIKHLGAAAAALYFVVKDDR